MKKFFNRLFKSKDTEILEVLKSIDKRMARIESCVQDNNKEFGARHFLSTALWNK